MKKTLSYMDPFRKLCDEIGKGASAQKRRKKGVGVFPFSFRCRSSLSLSLLSPPLSLSLSLSLLQSLMSFACFLTSLRPAAVVWLYYEACGFRGGREKKRRGERFFSFFFFDPRLRSETKKGRDAAVLSPSPPFIRTRHGEQRDHPHEEQGESDDGEALGVHCN